jgi:hypothetical protein
MNRSACGGGVEVEDEGGFGTGVRVVFGVRRVLRV